MFLPMGVFARFKREASFAFVCAKVLLDFVMVLRLLTDEVFDDANA